MTFQGKMRSVSEMNPFLTYLRRHAIIVGNSEQQAELLYACVSFLFDLDQCEEFVGLRDACTEAVEQQEEYEAEHEEQESEHECENED